ncbi:uncharacterized protein NECHADRAFT_89420 [Fusarium vanettenii 77-13-4]|uniref:Uncharacterized protein n=1 Tax=Fusarium vanettenii (strain ATCC MYA-4622 / CBS 123669 / FGSC 9596 / NRRL 45880 / 77-13-4) TaxID=660122 RepID=C7ZR52_FUSV7|nr:uncharacterized protein NECHADRAFT_89420 [Fusarium vanettenii 77-13-4]EEU33504.1 predicted protein [Fusarium vanettenii 77-13-4]
MGYLLLWSYVEKFKCVARLSAPLAYQVRYANSNAPQVFVFANGFIMAKCGANKIVEFVWGDDFLCYALSEIPYSLPPPGWSRYQAHDSSLPGELAAVVVLECAADVPGGSIDCLDHGRHAGVDADGAEVTELQCGARARDSPCGEFSVDETRVEDEAGQPRLLEVEAADEPVQCRLAVTVGALGGREVGQALHGANGSDQSRDGYEDGVSSLASAEKVRGGLEEGDRAKQIDLQVLVDAVNRALADGGSVSGDASIGNDNVQSLDPMLLLERAHRLGSVGRNAGVELDGDEPGALPLGRSSRALEFGCSGSRTARIMVV